MAALLLTAAIFAVAWVLGLGLLAALREDFSSLRLVLTAPALGVCVAMLAAFALNRAGLAIEDFGAPLLLILFVAAIALIARRRARPPEGLLPVLLVCAVGLRMTGAPMLHFGLDWLANANDDAASYMLGATRLLHGSYGAALDVRALDAGRDWTQLWTPVHAAGGRPGADVLQGLTSTATGLRPFEIYMPLILALHLCCACAAGALALQATRRSWAAALAAAIVVTSPMAGFGVLQQLAPQVLGLMAGTALAAVLMRRELHSTPGARVADIVVVGLLVAGVMLGYTELAPFVGVAYAGYLGVLLIRREIDARALPRLWLPAALVAVLILGPYVLDAAGYLHDQLQSGLAPDRTETTTFGYMLVPGALPGAVGLQTLPAPLDAPRLGLSIALAAIVLVAVVAIGVAAARRGGAAGIFTIVFAALATHVAIRGAPFGLFKMTMYAVPFAAAAVAGWVAGGSRRRQAIAVLPLLALGLAFVSTHRLYVDRSFDPIDARRISQETQLPAFRRALGAAPDRPVVSATDNIVLMKLEGVAAYGRPLFFLSRDLVGNLLRRGGYLKLTPGSLQRAARSARAAYSPRSFDLHVAGRARWARFSESTRGSAHLRKGDCLLALPSGTLTPFNRRHLPEGSRDLAMRPCRGAGELLAFINSDLGQHFYLTRNRDRVSYYQLIGDPYRPGRTASDFGRYALFRVLGPSHRVRVAVELTTGLLGDGANRIPSAAIVGSSRQRLPATGRGSARLISAPLRPQDVAGSPYLMVDLGVEGGTRRGARSGLADLYGKGVVLDPRRIAASVRDISLISESGYRRLRPPAALSEFPGDLADTSLEYSGIYDDGLVGEAAYAVLGAHRGDALMVEGDTLALPGGPTGGRLRVLVDGREVGRRELRRPGPFRLLVRGPAAAGRHRVELRFTRVLSLPAPDSRPVAARLRSLGFVRGG